MRHKLRLLIGFEIPCWNRVTIGWLREWVVGALVKIVETKEVGLSLWYVKPIGEGSVLGELRGLEAWVYE